MHPPHGRGVRLGVRTVDAVFGAVVGAVIGALLGGAFTWFVALRSATFGRDTALKMWEKDKAARDDALLHALQAEIDGALRLTYSFDTGRIARFGRSAWDAARGVPLPDEIFAALSDAYARTDNHNAAVDTLLARATNVSYDTRTEQDEVKRLAIKEIRPLFDNARYYLAKHRRLGPPWIDRPSHWPQQPDSDKAQAGIAASNGRAEP